MTQYLIRFDDLYNGMEQVTFLELRDFILEHKLPAILGVVPDWQDEHKVSTPIDGELFWNSIRQLEQAGCEISLHGHNHTLFEHPNLLNVNNYGEFAGLPLSIQTEKIKAGREVFEEQGLKCRSFMAPAHSFDENTLIALKECGIKVITDGKSILPYSYQGVTFIPQISSGFRRFPFGLITICLHPQWLTQVDYKNLSGFIKAEEGKIASFDDAILLHSAMKPPTKLFELTFRAIYGLLRTTKRLIKSLT